MPQVKLVVVLNALSATPLALQSSVTIGTVKPQLNPHSNVSFCPQLITGGVVSTASVMRTMLLVEAPITLLTMSWKYRLVWLSCAEAKLRVALVASGTFVHVMPSTLLVTPICHWLVRGCVPPIVALNPKGALEQATTLAGCTGKLGSGM